MPKGLLPDVESRELLYANWQERLRKRQEAVIHDWALEAFDRLVKAECDREHQNMGVPAWRTLKKSVCLRSSRRRFESFQARHFCIDVVGLDVQMNAALMLNALNLHDRLVRRSFQHHVVTASAGMVAIHRAPECVSPEMRGPIEI